MRVLLLGAGGMLAQDVAALASVDVELVSRTRAETDIAADRDVAEVLRDARPDVVINCAAYTVLDTSAYERIAGRPLPSWDNAVQRMLSELKAEQAA
jgi:dTDP-4-dehydrorhamnose reductase